VEQKIVEQHCAEYKLSPRHIELILQIVHKTRDDAAVASPASIRSSIGLARLAAERAKRNSKPVDNALLAQAGRLVLSEAIQMKPGKEVGTYLDSLFTEILGTTGA
jgi:MoxR-like ATPase